LEFPIPIEKPAREGEVNGEEETEPYDTGEQRKWSPTYGIPRGIRYVLT
jgi:hypothetical protein